MHVPEWVSVIPLPTGGPQWTLCHNVGSSVCDLVYINEEAQQVEDGCWYLLSLRPYSEIN